MPNQLRLKHADAARWLGISSKALRLYEDRGLVTPGRTGAGWRVYDAADLARAGDVVALRRLGLSLMEVERVLGGAQGELSQALDAHAMVLRARQQGLAEAIAKVEQMRHALAEGRTPCLAGLLETERGGPVVAFELPWPWGGETFCLRQLAPLTFIIGPLGSGKTRLARQLAGAIAGGRFVGLDRLEGDGAMTAGEPLQARVDAGVAWMLGEGATDSAALRALLVALDGEPGQTMVVDMVEEGLDAASQEALIGYLRRSRAHLPRLMLMTRSSAILDLGALGADEAIILCPANHSPPTVVAPYRGAPGYEAVETCLASPDVRARTAGLVVSGLPA